jgi:hypothetical protein
MLVDNGMKAAEKASSLFGGDGSTNRTEMFSSLTAEQKTFDDQVKAFLGDARYEQYQDYQKTVGERLQLNAFKQQLGADHPLTDQQSEQLLAWMHEEQQKAATAAGLPTGAADKKAAELQMMLSDEKLQAFMDSQAQANQNLYARAQELLSPDQLAAFGKFQTNQAQMMRLGLTMTRKMFGSDNPQPAPASAEQ